MDVDQVAYLRANSAAWRLLRADHAAVVLSFLGQAYVEENSAPIGAEPGVARPSCVRLDRGLRGFFVFFFMGFGTRPQLQPLVLPQPSQT